MLAEQVDELEVREVEVLVLVDEDVLEARAAAGARGGVVQQVDRAQDEVADVERALLGEQAVVVGEELRELALALGGLALEARGPARVVGRGDQLELAAVDALDDARQQRGAVAEEVVAAQRELVDAVEQQREAVGGGDGDEERVEADGGGLLAQQARGEVGDGVDRQLAERLVERVLDLRAKRGGGRGRAGHEQDLLRRDAGAGQPGDALDEHARLPGPRPAEHEQRPVRRASPRRAAAGSGRRGPGAPS